MQKTKKNDARPFLKKLTQSAPLSAADSFSEAKLLEVIFNSLQDCIALLDKNCNFIKVNQTFAKRCGKKVRDLISKNYFKVFPSWPNQIFQDVFKTKKPITSFARPCIVFNKLNRGRRYWDGSVTPILDKDNQVEMLILSLKDVTVQQQAFEEIVSLSKFPAENPNPVLRINAKGKVLYNNRAAYGIAKTHNAENNIKAILPKGLLAKIQKSIRLNAALYDLDVRLDGKVYSYNIIPVCAQSYVNVYGKDVTDKKNAQLSLIKTKQDLLEQQKGLKDKNIALSIVLEQIQSEKEKIRRDIANNIQYVIYPVWEKLKYSISPNLYVHLLDKALKEISSPYASFLTNAGSALSGREVEICNMIQGGFSSKQISKVLNISVQTVEKHRNHIRLKLNIKNKRQNLSTYLQSQQIKP
ncbi:MAG: PAS and helix-turn-helix domain-containing protein [Candidatus Omnitrophota bacterium]